MEADRRGRQQDRSPIIPFKRRRQPYCRRLGARAPRRGGGAASCRGGRARGMAAAAPRRKRGEKVNVIDEDDDVALEEEGEHSKGKKRSWRTRTRSWGVQIVAMSP